MDDIIQTVTESITGSGDSLPPSDYTEEEMHQQTTDFLLHMVNSMKELTEQQKAKMRASILEKAFNPEQLMQEFAKPTKVVEPTAPQDLVVLLVLIFLIVGTLSKKIKILRNFEAIPIIKNYYTTSYRLKSKVIHFTRDDNICAEKNSSNSHTVL
jgi:hypothetical protein